MTYNLDEKLIQCIRDIGQSYDIDRIILFGSRARGDHKPASDIDLAVFPLPEFKSRGHVTSDFEDLNTLLKIDTVFVTENIDPKLMENIGKEGLLLYERAMHKT